LDNKLLVSNRKEWRDWLEKNYCSCAEIWLVYYKKHTGKPSVSYNDSVEEALCFGWIDGIKKRIDDEKYTHKFTPRKKTSKWSQSNIKRAEKMIKEGKMTELGIKLFKERKSYNEKDEKLRSAKEVPLPKEIENELQQHSKAWTFFNSLAPSYKKQYILWLTTAKRQDTKEKRLKEAIELLKKNQKLGMK
jgi:uncharacterized protein YdeI (YjbR/CyaY-like superfamily)